MRTRADAYNAVDDDDDAQHDTHSSYMRSSAARARRSSQSATAQSWKPNVAHASLDVAAARERREESKANAATFLVAVNADAARWRRAHDRIEGSCGGVWRLTVFFAVVILCQRLDTS